MHGGRGLIEDSFSVGFRAVSRRESDVRCAFECIQTVRKHVEAGLGLG